MINTRKGLPLSSSRIEKIFPKLTPAQIRRVAAHGHIRTVERGEVLVEQGDTSVSFFVVITGELEIVRPYGSYETRVELYTNIVKMDYKSHKNADFRVFTISKFYFCTQI